MLFKLKQSNGMDETVSTIIGEEITIQNALVSGSGAMRIDGNFSGTISLESNVVLSQSGKLQGDIAVKNATIAGEMTGDIVAEETIHLASSAKLKGNIKAKNLVIDEGAKFNGEVSMDIDESASTKKKGAKSLEFNNQSDESEEQS